MASDQEEDVAIMHERAKQLGNEMQLLKRWRLSQPWDRCRTTEGQAGCRTRQVPPETDVTARRNKDSSEIRLEKGLNFEQLQLTGISMVLAGTGRVGKPRKSC